MYKETRPWEIPVIDLRIVENERHFFKSMEPVVKKYKEEPVTSRSIDKFFRGFYGNLGEISGFPYSIYRCPSLTQKELDRIAWDNMIVYLAPEIFTTEGLEGLCKVFSLNMSWTKDEKELLNFSHNPTDAGCIVTEKQLNAPNTVPGEYELRERVVKELDIITKGGYREELIEVVKAESANHNKIPRGGYSKEELIEKAKSGGGFGLGIPQYMIASKVSQLITGSPLDVNTFVRVPGTTYKGEDLGMGSDFDGHFHVFKCSSDKHSQILGVRSGLTVEKDNYYWWQSFIKQSNSNKGVVKLNKQA